MKGWIIFLFLVASVFLAFYSTDILNKIILAILGVSTLIFILEANGILPDSLMRYIHKNKYEHILKSLKVLGVRVAWDEIPDKESVFLKKNNQAYKQILAEMLKKHSLGKANVGQNMNFLISDSFIDVMGNSTDFSVAEEYAKILYAFIVEKGLNFDFIATPKTGSVFVSYELSKKFNKKLVLGVFSKGECTENNSQKFKSHYKLDYPIDFDLNGKVGIIVDDSSTGGRKFEELTKYLREQGARIESAVILFEPIGKGARDRLKRIELNLFEIQKGPSGKI